MLHRREIHITRIPSFLGELRAMPCAMECSIERAAFFPETFGINSNYVNTRGICFIAAVVRSFANARTVHDELQQNDTSVALLQTFRIHYIKYFNENWTISVSTVVMSESSIKADGYCEIFRKCALHESRNYVQQNQFSCKEHPPVSANLAMRRRLSI